MSNPKIIVIPGSARTGSHNARLGAVIAKQLNQMGADAQVISLADYPMPILNQDDEKESGAPENARKLAVPRCWLEGISKPRLRLGRLFARHAGWHSRIVPCT